MRVAAKQLEGTYVAAPAAALQGCVALAQARLQSQSQPAVRERCCESGIMGKRRLPEAGGGLEHGAS